MFSPCAAVTMGLGVGASRDNLAAEGQYVRRDTRNTQQQTIHNTTIDGYHRGVGSLLSRRGLHCTNNNESH
ncbi:hypothetical protein FJTKL_14799 [Diaporthe vaccinii]|uniref:Secreted protein n=1 Tax=Diaporthe vaccinii TaxID=105482 RepID=A0ABR4F809_9PEZI